MLCAVAHDSTRMRIQIMWGQELGDKKQRRNNTQVIAKPRFSWIFNYTVFVVKRKAAQFYSVSTFTI